MGSAARCEGEGWAPGVRPGGVAGWWGAGVQKLGGHGLGRHDRPPLCFSKKKRGDCEVGNVQKAESDHFRSSGPHGVPTAPEQALGQSSPAQ